MVTRRIDRSLSALGPVYLAVGRAEGFGSSAYLFLGPYW